MNNYTLKRNEFDADAFISLWNSVWDGCPSREQISLALQNSVYRTAVYDGEKIVGMARMIGDLGLCYYIKDVIVHPSYQGQGIGRILVEDLLHFAEENGAHGTEIVVELCALPDKAPFYEKFGFASNSGIRLRKFVHVV